MKTRLLCLILFVSSLGLNLNAQNAKEISNKAIDVMRFGSMEMKATLKIQDAKGRERVRQLETYSQVFDDITKTIMKFTSPADVRGTAMLIVDYNDKADDMWIHLPALRKTRRIVSGEKGKNFMGSEFTNADMSLPNMNDFDYEMLGDELFDGHECWKIQSSCKTEDLEDENGYMRKISWIDKENSLCYKVEFYDLEDELFKTQRIKEFQKQSNGKYFAFYMEMHNEQNGRRSILTTESFKLGSDLDEGSFSPNMLEK
ncbi:MAG: outer membrane lipoprotein-sorting protein [Bacteroidales bacterium]|nr:outer membrane lipoprotein-sorting protein [Bacteroidales bacterium]